MAARVDKARLAHRHIVTMTDTVSITSRAASRIKEILAAEPGQPRLRVAVEGGGCSGFQYDFKLDCQRAMTTIW